MKYLNNQRPLFLLICLCYNVVNTSAQNTPKFYMGDSVTTTMSQLVEPWSTTKRLYFKSSDNIPAVTIFQTYKNAFRLGTNDEMIMEDSHVDNLDIKHYYFQQYYKGIPLDGIGYGVHEKNGRTYEVNGIIVTGMQKNATPQLSENDALNDVLNALPGTYAWQDTAMENQLKQLTHDSIATYFPKGTLLFTLNSDTLGFNPYRNDFDSSNFVLAYKFNIYRTLPYSRSDVYVDANTGSIIKKFSTLVFDCNCCSGEVQTLYDGYRYDITTHKGFLQKYHLEDHCRHIVGKLEENNNNYVELKDVDNIWTSVTERPATSAYWSAECAFDYFNYSSFAAVKYLNINNKKVEKK